MSIRNDQKPSDDNHSLDCETETSLAVLEEDSTAPATPEEWTGPRCENCDAPMKSDLVTICRHCGWYASLGRCIEVDTNWETLEPDGESEQRAEAFQQVSIDLVILYDDVHAVFHFGEQTGNRHRIQLGKVPEQPGIRGELVHPVLLQAKDIDQNPAQ